jgi:hypothetical protein
MRFVSLVIEPLWQSGTQGKLLIGLLALLVVIVIASLVISLFPRSAVVTRHFLWLVALAGLGAFSAARNYIAANRAVVLAFALPGNVPPTLTPVEAAQRASEAISNSLTCLFVASGVFTISALVAIAPIWRSDLRRASRLAASLACALFALTSVFVWAYVERSHTSTHHCEGQERARCWLGHFEYMRAVSDVGSTVLFAFGSAALIVTVLFALRPEPESARAGIGLFSTGVVALALGGGAFAVTRGMAWDAPRPLSAPPEIARCFEWLLNPPVLPRARARCEQVSAPVVTCSASGAHIDGVAVSHAELEIVLRNKRELWMQLNPRRNFPEQVIVLAADDLPSSLVAPILGAARAAGYPHVGVLAEEPQPGVTTATLGVVPRRGHCCATFFELDVGGRPIESFSTWGALHETAAREAKLTVSVR